MEKIKIQTPENIEFFYELAGLGTRFLALLADTIIQFLLLLLVWLVFFLLLPLFSPPSVASGWEGWLKWLDSVGHYGDIIFLSILFLLIFAISWGYFIYFEVVWNGQTPGKRLMSLRVIREGGFPINFSNSLLRNLFRIVDFLPIFYGIGIISIFISKHNKRLGDIISRTLVIKEKKATLPWLDASSLQDLTLFMDTEKIDQRRYILIREFLARRNELTNSSRYRLAEKIAFPLMQEMNIKKDDTITYEEFLEEIFRRCREKRSYS